MEQKLLAVIRDLLLPGVAFACERQFPGHADDYADAALGPETMRRIDYDITIDPILGSLDLLVFHFSLPRHGRTGTWPLASRAELHDGSYKAFFNERCRLAFSQVAGCVEVASWQQAEALL